MIALIRLRWAIAKRRLLTQPLRRGLAGDPRWLALAVFIGGMGYMRRKGRQAEVVNRQVLRPGDVIQVSVLPRPRRR